TREDRTSMPQRRFLIASSLARLIRRDHDMVGRIVEGYFPARPERDHFISIEPGHCFLVLVPTSETAGVEERTEIPRSQADAILDELLDTLEESRLAAQLGGTQGARTALSRSQDEGRGASPEAPPQADQRQGSPDEEARRTSLMASLAEALNEEGRSDNLT